MGSLTCATSILCRRRSSASFGKRELSCQQEHYLRQAKHAAYRAARLSEWRHQRLLQRPRDLQCQSVRGQCSAVECKRTLNLIYRQSRSQETGIRMDDEPASSLTMLPSPLLKKSMQSRYEH